MLISKQQTKIHMLDGIWAQMCNIKVIQSSFSHIKEFLVSFEWILPTYRSHL